MTNEQQWLVLNEWQFTGAAYREAVIRKQAVFAAEQPEAYVHGVSIPFVATEAQRLRSLDSFGGRYIDVLIKLIPELQDDRDAARFMAETIIRKALGVEPL